jgi:FG-GAP repeat
MRRLVLFAILVVGLAFSASAQSPTSGTGVGTTGTTGMPLESAENLVIARHKISDTDGNFSGALVDWGYFGDGVAALDDLDGSGDITLAVGNPTGGLVPGTVWLLYVSRSTGLVRKNVMVSGMTGLENQDSFGSALCAADIDKDGLKRELLVGATRAGNNNAGAVYVLWLNVDGTVSKQAIVEYPQTTTGTVLFGSSVSVISAEGNSTKIAVGAALENTARGAVYLLSLHVNGSVVGVPKNISSFIQTNNDL